MRYLSLIIIALVITGCGDSIVYQRAFDEGYEAGHEKGLQEGLEKPIGERHLSFFDLHTMLSKHYGNQVGNQYRLKNIGSPGSTGDTIKIPLMPGGMHYEIVVEKLAEFEETLTDIQRGDWVFEVQTPEEAIGRRQEQLDRLQESIRLLKETHSKTRT
ncbi:MAG: hypothetical protein ACYS7Y_04420 [Planctomycetota bacterium]|jgi:hypothetical protein